MKVREIVKLIESDGWYWVRTKGSHHQYKHPTKTGLVTIPGKPGDEMAIGTYQNILNQGRFEIMKKYLIVVEKTDTGFSAFSPDVPGCGSTGKTKEEVERNIQEAIEFHLEGLRMEGYKVPEPSAYSSYIQVAA